MSTFVETPESAQCYICTWDSTSCHCFAFTQFVGCASRQFSSLGRKVGVLEAESSGLRDGIDDTTKIARDNEQELSQLRDQIQMIIPINAGGRPECEEAAHNHTDSRTLGRAMSSHTFSYSPQFVCEMDCVLPILHFSPKCLIKRGLLCFGSIRDGREQAWRCPACSTFEWKPIGEHSQGRRNPCRCSRHPTFDSALGRGGEITGRGETLDNRTR